MYKYYEKIKYFIYRTQLLPLKIFGAKLGKNIKVYGNFHIAEHPKKLTIGDYTTINHGVYINCKEFVSIGKNCRISAGVKIISTSLDFEKNKHHKSKPIIIGDNVWIASNAIITSGITIAEGSVIAANSLILSSTEPYTLYAGSPAKKIRVIN